MRTALAIVILLTISICIAAQEAPNVKYSGSGRKAHVSGVTNMLGRVDMASYESGWCKKTRLVTGKVVKRDFDEDQVAITSFVLADARDKRIPINLNEGQVGILGHNRNQIISELLGKGNRLQVQTYTCSGGGSGLFIFAEWIKLL